MIKYCLLFFLPLSLFSQDIKPEPLVRTDTLKPMEISRENAQLFEKTTTSTEMATLFKARTFPLNRLLLAGFFISLLPLVLFFLRRHPIVKDNTKIRLLKSLKDLEKSFASNNLEPGYQNLNIKMRQYIQERFGINAPYLTTEEFLEEASHHTNVDTQSRETLKAFLKESDRVKFKGKPPTFQDLDTSLKLVYKLIRNS